MVPDALPFFVAQIIVSFVTLTLLIHKTKWWKLLINKLALPLSCLFWKL
jgi:hypothetical protein